MTDHDLLIDGISNSGRPELDICAARVAMTTIREMDLQSVSIDDIKEALVPVFRGFAASTPRFNPGFQLFRSRLMDKPEHVSALMYPPTGIAALGRANREGEPVFYCCSSREPSFFELGPNVGHTLVLSKWLTTTPMLVNHVGYTREVFEGLGSGRRASLSERATKHHGAENAEVAAFLSGAFAQRISHAERYRYKLSVAIAEKMIFGDLFDALLYPSIAMRANSDNLAIKPKYADTNLRFVRAEFARIEAVRDLELDITVLDTAVELERDGKIKWRGRLDQWVLRNKGDQLIVAVENGRWVARDVNGNIIKPE